MSRAIDWIQCMRLCVMVACYSNAERHRAIRAILAISGGRPRLRGCRHAVGCAFAVCPVLTGLQSGRQQQSLRYSALLRVSFLGLSRILVCILGRL